MPKRVRWNWLLFNRADRQAEQTNSVLELSVSSLRNNIVSISLEDLPILGWVHQSAGELSDVINLVDIYVDINLMEISQNKQIIEH